MVSSTLFQNAIDFTLRFRDDLIFLGLRILFRRDSQRCDLFGELPKPLLDFIHPRVGLLLGASGACRNAPCCKSSCSGHSRFGTVTGYSRSTG